MQESLTRQPCAGGLQRRLGGEGEWNITVDVFRDLGMAFGVALLLDLGAAGRADRLAADAGHHHGGDSADDDRHHAGVLAARTC